MNKLIPSVAALITTAAIYTPSANAGVSFAFSIGPLTIASAPAWVPAPPQACVRTAPGFVYSPPVLVRPAPVFVAAPVFPAPACGYGPSRYYHRPHGRICW